MIYTHYIIGHHLTGSTMSLKLHFLNSHLNDFADNLGAESDEQGERFHQEMKTMEERYEGKWSVGMLADYCWGLIRETPPSSYNWQSAGPFFEQM